MSAKAQISNIVFYKQCNIPCACMYHHLGLIEYLVGESREAKALRDHIIFKIGIMLIILSHFASNAV